MVLASWALRDIVLSVTYRWFSGDSNFLPSLSTVPLLLSQTSSTPEGAELHQLQYCCAELWSGLDAFSDKGKKLSWTIGRRCSNFTSWMMQVFTFASWCFQPALPCTRTGELWKPMWKPTVDYSKLLLQCKQTTRVLSCFGKHCREIKPPGLLCCACGFFKKPSNVLSSHVRLNPEDQKLRSFLWAVDWESKWHSSDAEQLKSVLSRVHFGLTAPFACVLLKYFE